MDGSGHPLTLKVMRVSRPSLASAWQPFFSSSPSFSAHSTASVLSLQGSAPLPNHPKTLRDLTHAGQLLTLPSSFGAIQLGETFSSCLCINNEANVDVEGVSMKVEMQTASNKVSLAEEGGADFRLEARSTLETIVSHEIKELGQHVLACTVTYHIPSGTVPLDMSSSYDAEGSSPQTFRKFYKFAVTNPLSVKTKIHVPRSPTAQLSKEERDKIFLEVHIQNLTQDPLWFERMRLEALDGWLVEDANVTNGESIFSDSTSLMQPQDMRQYIYVMTPSPESVSSFPVPQIPGTIIPLGRLDISWRSSFGEPGRLLTSVLSRRIPLPPPPSPAAVSAIPSYLQKDTGSVSARPRSPQLASQRAGTPPLNAHAPYRRGSAPPTRPQSPGPIHAPRPDSPINLPVPAPGSRADLEVNLVVTNIPYTSIEVEKPFTVSFTLTISASLSSDFGDSSKRKERLIGLAVQHVLPQQLQHQGPIPPVSVAPRKTDVFSPKGPSSGFSTPSPNATPWRGNFSYSLAEKLLVASSREQLVDHEHERTSYNGNINYRSLPPPFSESVDEGQPKPSTAIVYMGSSVLFLPLLRFLPSKEAGTETQGEQANQTPMRGEAMQEFQLTFLPLRKGFVQFGGLRILAVEDRHIDSVDDSSAAINVADSEIGTEGSSKMRALQEWDFIGEVWVK